MADKGVCVICGRGLSQDFGKWSACSVECWRELTWRWWLEDAGTAYYPNPETHDKLGRRLAR